MLKMNDYLRITDAAEYLGIKVRTLRSWQTKGKIKSYMHPNFNRRLYLKSDLDQVLQGIKQIGEDEIISALEFADPNEKLGLVESYKNENSTEIK